jgi:hypothetical protein
LLLSTCWTTLPAAVMRCPSVCWWTGCTAHDSEGRDDRRHTTMLTRVLLHWLLWCIAFIRTALKNLNGIRNSGRVLDQPRTTT